MEMAKIPQKISAAINVKRMFFQSMRFYSPVIDQFHQLRWFQQNIDQSVLCCLLYILDLAKAHSIKSFCIFLETGLLIPGIFPYFILTPFVSPASQNNVVKDIFQMIVAHEPETTFH
jgi:hypothetical protein